MPLAEARISPFDRSFLFGDGVYEVLRVYGGRLFRPESHLNRLDRSAAAIRMRNPHTHAEWTALLQRAGRRQRRRRPVRVPAGLARCRMGPQPRAAAGHRADGVRLLLAVAAGGRRARSREGLACITAEDTRWARCDIKSVALLANVLLRQLACDAGASETILLRDGELMEGSASTVHVVKDGVLITPLNSTRILPSTTRSVVEEIADNLGIARRDARDQRGRAARARTRSGWPRPRAKCSR